jgi:hypothetical protein
MLGVARTLQESGFVKAKSCWIEHQRPVKDYVASYLDWTMIQPPGQPQRMLSTPERLSGGFDLSRRRLSVVIPNSCLETGRAASAFMLLGSLDNALDVDLLTFRWCATQSHTCLLQGRFSIRRHVRFLVGDFRLHSGSTLGSSRG